MSKMASKSMQQQQRAPLGAEVITPDACKVLEAGRWSCR